MPRSLDHSRSFPVADAAEARSLALALTDALIPALMRRKDLGPTLLDGRVADGAMSVETEKLGKIEAAAVHALFAEAEAEAFDPTRIYFAFFNRMIPEITMAWTKGHQNLTLHVKTSNVGWGHEVLDLAARVSRKRPVAEPPAATAQQAPTNYIVGNNNIVGENNVSAHHSNVQAHSTGSNSSANHSVPVDEPVATPKRRWLPRMIGSHVAKVIAVCAGIAGIATFILKIAGVF